MGKSMISVYGEQARRGPLVDSQELAADHTQLVIQFRLEYALPLEVEKQGCRLVVS